LKIKWTFAQTFVRKISGEANFASPFIFQRKISKKQFLIVGSITISLEAAIASANALLKRWILCNWLPEPLKSLL